MALLRDSSVSKCEFQQNIQLHFWRICKHWKIFYKHISIIFLQYVIFSNLYKLLNPRLTIDSHPTSPDRQRSVSVRHIPLTDLSRRRWFCSGSKYSLGTWKEFGSFLCSETDTLFKVTHMQGFDCATDRVQRSVARTRERQVSWHFRKLHVATVRRWALASYVINRKPYDSPLRQAIMFFCLW